MHQVLDEIQLELGRLIFTVQLQSLLKLVLGALVLACRAEDEAPHDPALGIIWLLLNPLSDLFDGLDNVSFFKLSE